MVLKKKLSEAIFFPILFAFSCSNPQPNSTTKITDNYISNKDFDSVVKATGKIPERNNIRAISGNERWVSTGFAVNVYSNNQKKVYSIYATNGKSKLTINYSNPELIKMLLIQRLTDFEIFQP